MKRDDRFRIFIDQLRHGHVEALKETFTPEFLDVSEHDLHFNTPVTIEGEAYLAEDELVIHFLRIHTVAEMPCRICNETVRLEVMISGNYQIIPLSEIKGGIFDYRELLREVILIEIPSYVECEAKGANSSGCPKRKELKQYIKEPEKEKKGKKTDPEDYYHPFADL